MSYINKGYEFYFSLGGDDVLLLPITPSELEIEVGSNNKVITLIDEGDINVLKSPSLIEVKFDARFPMRKYPYSRNFTPFQTYWDWLKDLKENKKYFRFIVARITPTNTHSADGKTNTTWDTNLLMSIEDMKLKEDATEGDDVIVEFKLKQYKDYGVRIISNKSNSSNTTSTSSKPRTDNKSTNASKSATYTVQSGDCLWNIAKAAYGDSSKWKKIYDANKKVIEDTAKKHGKSSSSNGHWIYPGTKLTIPDSKTTNLKVQKLW